MKTGFLAIAIVFLPLTGSSAKNKILSSDFAQIAVAVGRLLEEGHYTRQSLTGDMSKRVLATYLETLDYNKLFFTQEDIQALSNRYGNTLGVSVLRGNLEPAREIFSLYRKRVDDRVSRIDRLLKEDFTFRTNRTTAIEHDKDPWPANSADADGLWRDRVEGDLLQEHLVENPKESATTIVEKRYHQLQKDVDERSDQDVVQSFLDAVAQSYDPHSEYYGPYDLERFEIDMRLSLSGIGAEIRVDNGLAKIERLIPGGPAQLSGKIKVGDQITGVAQGNGAFVDTVEMRVDKVVEMILGKKGSVVRLQIASPNSSDPAQRKTVDLVRDNVKLTDKETQAAMIEKTLSDGSTEKLGWITIPSFYADFKNSLSGKSVSRDTGALIRRLQKQGVRGIVIDLRKNGGGSLDEAIRVSGLFLGPGPVVQVKNYNGKIEVLRNRERGAVFTGPLVVISDKLTASASEIFSAALQDYGRAVIVGDSTSFGKGTVQSLIELNHFLPTLGHSSGGGGALKLTVQKFYRVAGGSTQLRGVDSDIKLPSLTDNKAYGETSQKHPLPYDEVAPIISPRNRPKLFVEELRRRSSQRVSQDAQFQDIQVEEKRAEARLKSNRVSLSEKSRREESTQQKDQRKRADSDRKKAEAANDDRYYEITASQADNKGKLISKDRSEADINRSENDSSDDSESSVEDEQSHGLFYGDPTAREAINVLTDLVSLTTNPPK